MVDLDEEADDVIINRQRSFRRVQFIGITMLFIVMAMSGALAVYFYIVFGSLKEAANRLEHGAFDQRIASDRQTNQVAGLERSMRRTFDEFRETTASGIAVSPDVVIDPAPAIQAVTVYMRRGISSLRDELLMRNLAESQAQAPALAALMNGTLALLAWNRSGDTITKENPGLPDLLVEADRQFEIAASDAALKPLAKTGAAWIDYLFAASNQSNYALGDCKTLQQTISAASPEAGPQSYFWAASCDRKLGDRLKALNGYAHVLSDEAEGGEGATVPVRSNRDDAELLLDLNAFHGLGTQFISTPDVAASDIAYALTLAKTRCASGAAIAFDVAKATLADRMNLARKCLERAIEVRRKLGQTPNQLSGSQENISFAFLREHDFKGAFDNAQKVAGTGYFAWNELVRALAAQKLADEDTVVRAAGADALRHVSYFTIPEFNPCELKVLLDGELFTAADAIVKEQHDGKGLQCNATPSAGGSS